MFNIYPYLNVNDLNLDWIINHFKEFIDEINSLDSWRAEHEIEYEELKKLYDDIVNGNFPPKMYTELHNWVVNNSASIIGELVKTVFFGLTDTGYFVAYIPDSWDDIQFNTSDLDIVISGVDYGHLILSY